MRFQDQCMTLKWYVMVEAERRMPLASGKVVRPSLTSAVSHHSLLLSLPYPAYHPYQPPNKV